MDILQIIGIALIGVIAALIVKPHHKHIAIQISIATAIIIFLSVSTALGGAVEKIMQLAGKFDVDVDYIGIVIRLIGIAYICQIACEVCRDAGENAIAANVELGGKVLVLLYSLPIIEGLLNMIANTLT